MSESEPLLIRKTTYNFGSISNGRVHADLHVERPVYKQEQLNLAGDYEKPKTSCKEYVSSRVASYSCTRCIQTLIPVLKWLPAYNWKQDIAGDVISGITVAIMHIPQGIAYGLLGNVPPVVGIYMAFFPVLIYFFFGTSRHVSMGTFAIVCLMTGKIVSTYAIEENPEEIGNNTATYFDDFATDPIRIYTPIQVATTVTFTVAMFQLLMYVLRLGVVTTLLSETLVNGFTCASAFHVVASQLKDLFGLPIPKRRGLFSFIYTVYDFIMAIPLANRTAVSISMTAIVIMVINNEIFKPWLSKKTKIPLPIELLAVVVGTATSYFVDFDNKYNVTVVGTIPTGLPEPTLPVFSLIPTIAMDCLVITFISYSITMSMALIFAQKRHYEVDANQELFAMGLSNCFGSFFSSMPITASLSRSMIQETVGGVTQLASIVSCLILLVVLLWIGPVFEYLPRCVLASIIVVALKGMLMQCTKLKRFWQLSKWDALVWLVTFLTTVLVSIAIGLMAGLCVSLLSIFIQGQVPYTCLMGVVPNTDLYLDCKRYKGVQEIEGIKIFHYCGALNFAAKAAFKKQLNKKVGFDPTKVLASKKPDNASNNYRLLTRCVIVDFSAITYVDPTGVDLLRQLTETYEKVNVSFYIANCSGPIYETLKKCDKYEKKESTFNIYPTIHDAVLYAQVHARTPTDS